MGRLPLAAMVSVQDFERAAREVLPEQSYAYYATAACDNLTDTANAAAWSR